MSEPSVTYLQANANDPCVPSLLDNRLMGGETVVCCAGEFLSLADSMDVTSTTHRCLIQSSADEPILLAQPLMNTRRMNLRLSVSKPPAVSRYYRNANALSTVSVYKLIRHHWELGNLAVTRVGTGSVPSGKFAFVWTLAPSGEVKATEQRSTGGGNCVQATVPNQLPEAKGEIKANVEPSDCKQFKVNGAHLVWRWENRERKL